jgi:DNA-directed RNA polymerase subunit beta'
MELDEPDNEVLEEQTSEDGVVTKLYKFRRTRQDAEGNVLSQYIKTTVGRVIYNKTVLDSLAS